MQQYTRRTLRMSGDICADFFILKEYITEDIWRNTYKSLCFAGCSLIHLNKWFLVLNNYVIINKQCGWLASVFMSKGMMFAFSPCKIMWALKLRFSRLVLVIFVLLGV